MANANSTENNTYYALFVQISCRGVVHMHVYDTDIAGGDNPWIWCMYKLYMFLPSNKRLQGTDLMK